MYSSFSFRITAMLAISLVVSFFMAASANFHQEADITWGDGRGRILNNGELLTLSLDKASGSGFQSKNEYLFGKIDMQLKLVAGNSAGTVTAYYLSSKGSNWDEIDFEFLGNLSGDPYILHTNVFSQGKGNREQQFYLWFDPTADFHTYSILWNPQRIIFSVDSIPIREFKNLESIGVPFPKKQAMRIYSSLWNADDWATRGGLVKTDWNQAPFTASYRNFKADACLWSSGASSCSSKSSSSNGAWLSQELDTTGQERMKSVQKKYIIYNYCTDANRFPQNILRVFPSFQSKGIVRKTWNAGSVLRRKKKGFVEPRLGFSIASKKGHIMVSEEEPSNPWNFVSHDSPNKPMERFDYTKRRPQSFEPSKKKFLESELPVDFFVTETTKADEALKLLKEKTFDIAIIDVIREDMDGFKLLETIGLEMDIPVVMVSANDEVSNVMKGIRNGARDYLLKPVRMEEIKNIWQHVVRKNLNNLEKIVTEVKMDPNPMSDEEQEEANTESNANGGVSDSLKKARVSWSKDLHHKFLDAIQQLDDVVPKKILKVMNVPSLTRENVASHLQKYRSMLKKQNARKSQQNSSEVDTNWNSTGNSMLTKSSNTSHRHKTKRPIQSLMEYKPFNIPKPSHHNVFQNYAQFQGMHNSGLENPNLASSWTGSPFHVPEYRVTSGKFLNYNVRRECGPSSMPFYSYPTLAQLNPAQQMDRDPSAGMCAIPQHPFVLGSAQNVFPGQNDGRSSLNRSSSSGNVNRIQLAPGCQNSMQFPVSTDLAENVQSKLGQQYPTETSENVSSFHPNNSSFMDDDLSVIFNQFSSNGPPRL